ncbi:MAG: hypothetical protein D8M59_17075 [Planctomycetes bacterium]|nr:hypothetical protein [Planctomycetota bacterium]
MNNMRITLLIFLVLLFSCNSRTENSESWTVGTKYSMHSMYGLMIGNFEKSTNLMEKEMYATINQFQLADVKNAEKYDSLTVDYKNYLESVYQKLFEEAFKKEQINKDVLLDSSITNTLFFKNDFINDYGNEYLKKQNTYHQEILKLIEDNKLKQRINLILSTESKEDRTYQKIEYLEWYFKDQPPIVVMFYIKYIQNEIVSFENTYFKNIALTK